MRVLSRKLHAVWRLGSPSDISGAAYTRLRFHRNANTHGNLLLVHVVCYAPFLLVCSDLQSCTAPLLTVLVVSTNRALTSGVTQLLTIFSRR